VMMAMRFSRENFLRMPIAHLLALEHRTENRVAVSEKPMRLVKATQRLRVCA